MITLTQAVPRLATILAGGPATQQQEQAVSVMLPSGTAESAAIQPANTDSEKGARTQPANDGSAGTQPSSQENVIPLNSH